MSIDVLVSRQNRDGGWPYVRGGSWTEPTVYAILALLGAGEREASARGIDWLRDRQRGDGGWSPQGTFDESTWVTSLAALLPVEALGEEAHAKAIHWLLGTQGEETSTVFRVRQWLLGQNPPPENEFPGWPWIPGAAAWVGPTSLAILALDKEYRRKPSREIGRRIEEGRNFLLRRMCVEGGWNHGSVRALGYESAPYPETTGMALAAMRGVKMRQVPQSIAVAQKLLNDCRSADAFNWLRLGLLAHGQMPAGHVSPQAMVYRTTPETSLDLVVTAATQGKEMLWKA